MLYNPYRKEVSYFQNGGLVGTAFTNVEGEDLYVCLEICHLGSYEIMDNIELPDEDQIKELIWLILLLQLSLYLSLNNLIILLIF